MIEMLDENRDRIVETPAENEVENEVGGISTHANDLVRKKKMFEV